MLLPLIDRITETPPCTDRDLARMRLADLRVNLSGSPLAEQHLALVERADVARLLEGVFSGSPYLSGLMLTQSWQRLRWLALAPEDSLAGIEQALGFAMARATTMPEAMTALRGAKTQAALVIALADLGGVWSVPEVTRALTRFADAAITAAVGFLLRVAARDGRLGSPGHDHPEADSGYFVLAMGKHGAGELNYSSDVDLIVFYDPARAAQAGIVEPQALFVRLTRDLVRLLEERTGDGYVFRVDLRLRPDAGATPLAMSTQSALIYYETFGQNWERAAMIKARVVAGDGQAGGAFLAQLQPYIWRKYLDFAAIADIHAMKRQIQAVKGFGEIAVAGHDIKLGRGGIREIEFFVQTQQLIAGGRQPDLREPATLAALAALTRRGWITEDVRAGLEAAYLFLRRLEHRLQMVDDEQTQRLPADPARLERLAHFSGFAGTPELSAALRDHLTTVQTHYAALFEGDPALTSGVGNMVFAGEADDPQTVGTLVGLGFTNPASVIATVRGWHHGRYPAVRGARSREMLTVMQPVLIEALAKTANPDSAFLAFDRFLSELPTGVQLFALLRSTPSLLTLLADILGSAPRLAGILSRRRRLLDAVLDPRFFGLLPSDDDLTALFTAAMRDADSPAGNHTGSLAGTIETAFEDRLDGARIVGSEQAFLIGVRLLTGTVSATQAGVAYASLAEHVVAALHTEVAAQLAARHGMVPSGEAAVLAMGKLGGREMTAASDLDLILIYDYPDGTAAAASDGPRSLSGPQYFARLTQRLIAAISAPTAEGALYEVDLRLRPSGHKGPVATRLASFVDYQDNEAWTWEHMALTRARVVSGPPALRRAIEQAIGRVLTRRRIRAGIAADVAAMRALLVKEKGTDDIWELKQVRGGLVDIEFIAQYLQLAHAHAHPGILDTNTAGALTKLTSAGILTPRQGAILQPAIALIQDITQVLRLCYAGPFAPAKAPEGLKLLLARFGHSPDLDRLEVHLREVLAQVAGLFDEIIVRDGDGK